jgi:hypothetical protein
MKKKLIGVLIAVVFLMVMFATCSDEPQEVKVVGYDVNASEVASVTVETSKDYVLITWDGVENGTGYTVYYQKEKTKTVTQLGGGWHYRSYDVTTGTSTKDTDPDPDKWSYLAGTNKFHVTGNYRFGVQTIDADPAHRSSGIKWSDYYPITAK